MLGESAASLGGTANDLNGSSCYALTATPSWLFPVVVFRERPGR